VVADMPKICEGKEGDDECAKAVLGVEKIGGTPRLALLLYLRSLKD
jgi:hypothetical protein